MTSKSYSQNAFINPDAPPSPSLKDEKASCYKHPTVYDAVAGKISAAGFIPKQSIISSTRDTASSSASAVSPETALFRSKNAPPRYAESDIYFANEKRGVVDLPESDLLKNLHSYTSDFYSRVTKDGGKVDWRSLDETALIALGILLEEASLEILGGTGDLVFTEGEEIPQLSQRPLILVPQSKARGRPSKKRRVDVTGD